jgi:hypothetical protein
VHCRPVLKLFADNNEYQGRVMAIDAAVLDEDGTELCGIWFRIR